MNGSKTAKSFCIKPATIYHITTYLLSYLSSLHVFNSVNVYSATVTLNSYFVGSADRWMSRAKYMHIIQSYSVVLFSWCGATYEPEKQHWCKLHLQWVMTSASQPQVHASRVFIGNRKASCTTAKLQYCCARFIWCCYIHSMQLMPKTAYIAFILCNLHWWYFKSIS